MTDMRATERLLEVIEERARVLDEIDCDAPVVPNIITDILLAIAELRKRGDTLVRADDLRLVMFGARAVLSASHGTSDYADAKAAVGRLENALGGKLR